MDSRKKVFELPGIQRIVVLIGVLLTFSAEAAWAQATTAPSWAHTRPLSSTAIELIANAAQRSSIVTNLLEDLEETDIVVYIMDSMPGVISGPTSYLAFLSLDESARYLLIRIDRFRLSPTERIALLGHELQHALEIAAAPEVKDPDGVVRLYRRIGWEGEKDHFESKAAQTVGNRVRSQLARRDSVASVRRGLPPDRGNASLGATSR